MSAGMSAETRFHRARRMFCVVGQTLYVAPPDDPRSHMAWMIAETLVADWSDASFERIVRGYYLDGNLVGYVGQDFSTSHVYTTLSGALDSFVRAFDLSPDTMLWAGARKASVGEIWEGRNRLGTVEMLRDLNAPGTSTDDLQIVFF